VDSLGRLVIDSIVCLFILALSYHMSLSRISREDTVPGMASFIAVRHPFCL